MKTAVSLFLAMVIMGCIVEAEERVVDMIVARVDDSIITLSDLEEACAPSLADIRKNYPENQWEEKFADARQRVLMQMIDELVCVRAARDLEITVSDDEITAHITSIWKNAGIASEEEFREALKNEGVTIDEFRETIRRQFLTRRVLQREIYSKVKVTEAEIREYYEQHRSTYGEAGKVRVALLLVEVKSDSPQEWKVAEEKTREIYNQIKAGADFARLVREHSNGPETETGGDIGFIERGKGLSEFEEAAFSRAAGEIPEPFKTRYGWNIIKILEVVEPRTVPLEDKRAEIERSLQMLKSKDYEVEWFEKQRAKTFIERQDLSPRRE